MVEMKSILYPTDFSEHSLAALPLALELKHKFGATLHVVHVVDQVYQYWMAGSDNAVPVIVSDEELIDSANKQMGDFVDKYLEAEKGDNMVVKVLTGRPFLEIIRYARDEQMGMIVIATHGHGALASMLLGSVTEKVLRKANCPVLSVRHEGYEFEMP